MARGVQGNQKSSVSQKQGKHSFREEAMSCKGRNQQHQMRKRDPIIELLKLLQCKEIEGGKDQCKEIEENSRMGKTRDLFKKIRDTKGTFHVKMGSIKDRNSMYLIEAEDIKKRWQEYTEELYKKYLHDPDNHEGVITHTHLELDILEQVGLRKHQYEQS